MIKWLLVGLVFLGLLWMLAVQSFEAWDARNLRDHAQAVQGLFRDAAKRSCLPKQALRDAAEAKGWQVEDPAVFGPESEVDRPGQTAIRVHVDPAMNFAKEPGLVLWFGPEGCFVSVF